MADVEIEIDGQKLTAKANQTVIQVADEAGIYIPRFCYHSHLSIPANCRMCLVEVEKMPKAVPACATPVMQGMKVYTKSQKTLLAQRAVMEFLLINHPLDCPICDQGGECELQDLSLGYGSSQSSYKETKRSVADQNLGPLISTEMTRCIYCTRCVRFGDEIAGVRELGAIGRGEFTEIGTYIQHAMRSEVSGNIVDLCPVGALTSKPFRFTARAWELDQSPGVSPHDCVGANLNIHTRYGVVMRVVPRENDTINHTWIADRDRFSYTGLYHPDRLTEPMARIDGQLQTVTWERAFEIAARGIQETIAQYGPGQFAGLASTNTTLEELYLLQKMVKGLGSPHVDHRLQEMDPHNLAYPPLEISVADIAQCDAILLVGSNIQKEQPSMGLHVRKASLNGAEIVAINSVDYEFNFKVNSKHIVAPHLIANVLAELLENLKTNAAHILKQKQKVVILLGASALHHPQASVIRFIVEQIANQLHAQVGFLTQGANAQGAIIAEALPAEGGLGAYELFSKPRQAYLLLNIEPEFDCANTHLAQEALKQAACVVALSTYRCASLEEQADVILPMTPFTETSGTFVNVNGTWQSFKGVAQTHGSSRPGWKILRVLGNFLQLDGFNYESSEEVKHEVKKTPKTIPKLQGDLKNPPFSFAKNQLMRLGDMPIYAVDALVRRATPLQETQAIMEGELAAIRLHPQTAEKLNLNAQQVVRVKQQGTAVTLPVMIDKRVALDTACIASGISATSSLGDSIGLIEIETL